MVTIFIFSSYVYARRSLHWSTNNHSIDVIMTTMASQITSLTVVYSIVYSDADQRKHQSSASLVLVWGIHRDRWIPRTKGQLREKCFHLMTSSLYLSLFTTKSMLALWAHGQDRTYYSDKSNLGNPEVNKGCCPPLTANRTSADCMENSPGPPIQYIPLGVYHIGGSTLLVCYFLRNNVLALKHQ